MCSETEKHQGKTCIESLTDRLRISDLKKAAHDKRAEEVYQECEQAVEDFRREIRKPSSKTRISLETRVVE